MLKLSNVTLVMIETREHGLAQLAVQDCLDRAHFADVVIFTDRPHQFRDQGRIVEVEDWPEKIGWSRCHWQEVAPHVGTSHALSIQWDSWIVAPEMWTDEFLQYDYVGAPWWYKDGMNVGNGGFCLRSTKLMRYLRKHRDRFPCTNALDDDLLCRKYRPSLQEEGFTWAPDDLALKFAFEVVRPDTSARHFGFHACFNFGYGCGGDLGRLMERAKLMLKSPSLTTTNSVYWNGFINRNPALVTALVDAGYELPRCMERIALPGEAGELEIREALKFMNMRDQLKEAKHA